MSLRTRLYRLDLKGSPYLYVFPFFALFAVFGLFPLVYTAFISTTSWSPRRPGSEDDSVGMENYQNLLGDENFHNALVNTFGIGLVSTVPQLLLALGIAHLLNYSCVAGCCCAWACSSPTSPRWPRSR